MPDSEILIATPRARTCCDCNLVLESLFDFFFAVACSRLLYRFYYFAARDIVLLLNE